MIQEEEPGRGRVGKRFPQLLYDPGAGGMAGDVQVENLSPVVTNNKEAVENAEGDGRNGEEVHGGKGFPVIAQKTEPSSCGFTISGRSLHPARDRSLGHSKPQHMAASMSSAEYGTSGVFRIFSKTGRPFRPPSFDSLSIDL